MNYKTVYCLPGIGRKSGDILLKAGYDKVEKIYEIFKSFHFDAKKCQHWLKQNCGSYSNNALRCYKALKKHYDEHEAGLHNSSSKKQLAPPLSLQNSNSNSSARVLDTSIDKKSNENRIETVKLYYTPDEDIQNVLPSMNQPNNDSELKQTVSPLPNPKSITSVALLDMSTDKKIYENRTETVKIYYTPDENIQNVSPSMDHLNNNSEQVQTVSPLLNPKSNSSAASLDMSTDKKSDENRTETVEIYYTPDENEQNKSVSKNQHDSQTALQQTASLLQDPNSNSSVAVLDTSTNKESDENRKQTVKIHYTLDESGQYKSPLKNQQKNRSELPQFLFPLQCSDSNSSVKQLGMSNDKKSVENSMETVDFNYDLHEDGKNKSLQVETCQKNKKSQTHETVSLLQSHLKSSTKESLSYIEIVQNMSKLKEKLDVMAAQICDLEREKKIFKEHIRKLEGELHKVRVLQYQQDEKICNVTEKNDKRAKTFNYVINEQIELRKQEQLSTHEQLNKLQADILKLSTEIRKPSE